MESEDKLVFAFLAGEVSSLEVVGLSTGHDFLAALLIFM